MNREDIATAPYSHIAQLYISKSQEGNLRLCRIVSLVSEFSISFASVELNKHHRKKTNRTAFIIWFIVFHVNLSIFCVYSFFFFIVLSKTLLHTVKGSNLMKTVWREQNRSCKGKKKQPSRKCWFRYRDDNEPHTFASLSWHINDFSTWCSDLISRHSIVIYSS